MVSLFNLGILIGAMMFVLAGFASHKTMTTYLPEYKNNNFNGLKYIFLLLTVLIAVAGVSTHALIASSYTEVAIRTGVNRISVPIPSGTPQRIVIPPRTVTLGQNDGVYNFTPSFKKNGYYRYSFSDAFSRSLDYCYGWDSDWMDPDIVDEYFWYIPYPFFIPYVLHLFIVAITRTPLYFIRFRSAKLVVLRPFATHALVASLYAYALMVLFQSSRMLWASDGWRMLVYLNAPAYGNALLYILLGLTICLYIYSIIGTAKLTVVRRKNDRFKRCLRCGYTLGNLNDPCPECGTDPREPVPSRLRICPLIFLGGAAVTFFSPFILGTIIELVR